MEKTFIEEQQHLAQEYGALHNEDCPCMSEDPDWCNCENFKMVDQIIKDTILATEAKVRKRWEGINVNEGKEFWQNRGIFFDLDSNVQLVNAARKITIDDIISTLTPK